MYLWRDILGKKLRLPLSVSTNIYSNAAALVRCTNAKFSLVFNTMS